MIVSKFKGKFRLDELGERIFSSKMSELLIRKERLYSSRYYHLFKYFNNTNSMEALKILSLIREHS